MNRRLYFNFPLKGKARNSLYLVYIQFILSKFLSIIIELVAKKTINWGGNTMKESLSDTINQRPKILNKLPEVTLIFWIIKVLTTGMGEVVADFSDNLLTFPLAATLGAICLVFALVLQFSARRYVPWIYWLTVVMVSIFGTMFADILDQELGIPLVVSTAGFVITQVVIFIVWYALERNLSVNSIYTWRREAFYWLTVMDTFALGTALGDFTAVTLQLGFFASGILFAILIAIPAIGYRWFGMNSIFAFWFAYIMTRPLGASFTDWLWIPTEGCLGLGNGPISLVLTITIIALVAYLTVKDNHAKNNHGAVVIHQ
ncbi:MAG: hypothetical protein H6Q74_1634 [Firmicutes bacterium]|nr:hypothetical protein [Bacillota bacterium]